MSNTTTTTTTTTTSTTPTKTVVEDKGGVERIKKRDPGHITKVIKIGVVGDGTVGKTTLLLSYITQAFITEYTPTVFDNFSAIEEVEDGKLVNVILWDTAGQDDYAQIRTTCYSNCRYDVFLLCFSCINRDSFDNVKHKWLPELKQNSPGTPFILCGTKTDLRDSGKESPNLTASNTISFKEGQKRAKEIKAHNYMECTSIEPASVAKVVMEAINIIIERERIKRVTKEKQWKKEAKKEEKEAKLEQKAKAKIEQLKLKEDKKKSPSSSPTLSGGSGSTENSPKGEKKNTTTTTTTSTNGSTSPPNNTTPEN
ncbi:Rho GTPase [Tieghemostelium lacteum]|uniref:Rho GTPase n=1 Tax=Tieghemostelium lacteum TaxID=361077 RepID=A0A151ZJX9_TIELA|nr:Rho GTPase [Tieghemostelium lacteum]|eukprot:KYQ94209.1 Rho GTPase [Tieghemostelium lacteum]